MEYIAENLKEGLKEKLNMRNFYSLLTDGFTDSAVNKKEAFYVLTFYLNPEGSIIASVELNYFHLAETKTYDAESIANAIEESFKRVNICYLDKLVGFGSDGTSVNRGSKEGIKTILQRDNEWLTFGWCVAHRLELALKDAFNGTAFDEIEELLLRLYYLYKKSPKS